MYCPSCGTPLDAGAIICHHCGSNPEEITSNITRVEGPSDGRQVVILVDESHKERTHMDEYLEFKARLGRRGEVIVHTEGPLTAASLRDVDILIIGGPEHPWIFGRGADQWHAEEVNAIHQFVVHGGGLLIMGDSLVSAERISAVTAPYGVVFTSDLVGEVCLSGDDIMTHSIVEGVKEISLGVILSGGGNILEVEEPAHVLAEHQGRPVLAYCECQAGHVVAMSSLSAFSQQYIDKRDNAVLLKNIIKIFLGAQRVEETDRVVGEIASGETESSTDSPLIPSSDKSSGINWEESLKDLICVWKEWEEASGEYGEECAETEHATFPEHRLVLMEVWERDIKYWQPRFIELAQREIALWGEIKRVVDQTEAIFQLIHAIQVNRAMALSYKEQHLEILEEQLVAMVDFDKERVDSLLAQALQGSKVLALLSNDYSHLMLALRKEGIPLPKEHIPEIEEILDEDYEIGMYIVERLIPKPMPGMADGPDPWMSEYEEWFQAREKADEARAEFSRYSDTASMYMDTLRAVRQQSFDQSDW